MKIICPKSKLLYGVSIALKAVSSKTTLPILECILIEANNQQIKLTANDMELGIETLVEGEILEEGKIAINAKLFSEIVRKLPENDVTIETDSNYQAMIRCEKAKFNISGKSGEDFSHLPEVERDKFITLSQFTLKEVIRQTIFSISDNENNKLMTGELFEVNGARLNVVSLDGHRISIRNIELKESYDSVKVVVPGKTLSDINKILSGDADKDVRIYFTAKHILFEFDSTKVVSRLLEGEYYRISQMLSSDYETKIRINKKEFLDCIDRASLLIRESDKKPIIIHIEDGNMELKIQSSIGSMKEDIMIQQEGKDILIGFNPKFLMDALRVIDDEEITIYLVNPKAPCFIKDEQESYIYLILPVNFNVAANA
ncbi:MAG: DNA polymerase III subunit beta [Firmicutes bacterium]|uniref:Beta sliding clamp n=1 Tax=Candidatus Scybalomonas excrementavium TaxID=2840943 RepID=A0A9D9N789_9FIRM|nr:DNA polymerase III subunit beta [Candidatus Scybalomonas excrementavium]